MIDAGADLSMLTQPCEACMLAGLQPHEPSRWVRGLSQEKQYEWLANCYQMRIVSGAKVDGTNEAPAEA